MIQEIRIICYGLGPVGARIAKLVSQKTSMKIVGALEMINIGKDIGEVIGLDRKLGVKLSSDVQAVLSQGADVVIQATVSSASRAGEQLVPIIKAGINVVSTCEELSFPWRKHARIAAELDTLAKENNVTILATGVNPGFCMDAFPLALTAVCESVESIRVERVQDARARRLSFQKKIGAGCTDAEFEKLKAAGKIGHVGLEESVSMIAAALGWGIDEYTETIEPVIAKEDVSSDHIAVKAGQMAGVEQTAVARMKGRDVITLQFRAYFGATQSHDTVYITGIPNMKIEVEGGFPGDIATSAIVVNSIPRVIDAPPGLITMKDLPLVSAVR